MSPSPPAKTTLLAGHWRPLVAAVAGVATWLAAGAIPALADHGVLIGWDVAALVYIALLWILILTASEKDIRDRAGRQDEKASAILIIELAIILASLGGIVAALLAPDRGDKAFVAILVAVTLTLGWALMHSVFVPHYAHRHFVESARKKDAGIGFPGEPPTSYLDFAYVAFTVGATFQVSDNTIGSTRLRNLVTAHGLSAYVYNTAILAVGINLLAGAVSG